MASFGLPERTKGRYLPLQPRLSAVRTTVKSSQGTSCGATITIALETNRSVDQTVNLEAQHAELKAVLASRYFTRAPKLARLLSYLCEKSFAGESAQIKEYSIGVDVFERGAHFDQDSDSIVRVEANRLRRQLAEFYAREGSLHTLQITIPVGQYVPEFVHPVLPEPAAPEPARPQRHNELRLPGRPIWWIAGLAGFLLTGAVVALLWQHRARQPAAEAAPQSLEPAEAPIGPPAGDEVRILAGASRSFVDHAGKLWSADTWFDGGASVKTPGLPIGRTQDPDFYRASRQGQFRYRIPLKKGIYELHLHFAETQFDPEQNGGGEGSRIFNVQANGKVLLSHFDIVADTGASRTADVKVFTDVSPAADGMLTLEFKAENGNQATLSALEILPGLRGRIRPVRLLARQTPYYSNDSHWWSPDSYFQGGQMATYSAPVGGTDDPELYETERWGNFSYAIPVAPGKYSVVLHFAARHGSWNQPGGTLTAVAHRFNVFCNGADLLKNFDLPREARQSDVVVRRFTSLEPNAQGKLLLSFVPVEGYATVTGIEVLPQ
jgi:hypothetical protein